LTDHFLELFKNQHPPWSCHKAVGEFTKVNEQVRLGLKNTKVIGEVEDNRTAWSGRI